MGMMAQMALKDLGEKTKRGQLGRVLKGRIPAGIAYGYKTADVGGDGRGARLIDPDEAGVVRRIFKEFASGKSPEAIARDLNRERVPGPAGRLWSNTTIRGQLDRGTGILNNALYRGVIEWNRCAYTKNPKTGKRVARPNPPNSGSASKSRSCALSMKICGSASKLVRRHCGRRWGSPCLEGKEVAAITRKSPQRGPQTALSVVRPVALRLLQRPLRDYRSGPLRLLHAQAKGNLRQSADHYAPGDRGARPGRSEGAIARARPRRGLRQRFPGRVEAPARRAPGRMGQS